MLWLIFRLDSLWSSVRRGEAYLLGKKERMVFFGWFFVGMDRPLLEGEDQATRLISLGQARRFSIPVDRRMCRILKLIPFFRFPDDHSFPQRPARMMHHLQSPDDSPVPKVRPLDPSGKDFFGLCIHLIRSHESCGAGVL